MPLRAACRLVAALVLTCSALAPLVAHAADERGTVYLYVLEKVRLAGRAVDVVVPIAADSLADQTGATLPTKAFDALKQRAPDVYGKAEIDIVSDTELLLKLADATDPERVQSETYWTLASMGFGTIKVGSKTITPARLAHGSLVPLLQPWDLLSLDSRSTPAAGFVLVDDQPVRIADAVKKLAAGDVALKRAIANVLKEGGLRQKLKVLTALRDVSVRERYFKTGTDIVLPALEDEDTRVRQAALDVVEETGAAKVPVTQKALEAVVEKDRDGSIKLRAVKILSAAGIKKYDDLLEIEKLKGPDEAAAYEAVKKLSASKQTKIAAPALGEALGHSSSKVRDAAFVGLVALGAWDLLESAMGNDQLGADVRERIAGKLAESGSAAQKDKALAYMLDKGGPEAAIAACEAYGKRASKTATPKLAKALKHADRNVRLAAARALAHIKDADSLVPLAEAASAGEGEKKEMTEAAIEILGTLKLDDVRRLTDSENLMIRQLAIRSLAAFAKGDRPNPAVVATLTRKLDDKDPEIVRAAVFALARIRDDGIARDLMKRKDSPDAEIRAQVAVALGASKLKEAGDVLIKMVADADRHVRLEAVKGLRLRKESAALPTLKALVRNPDKEVKREVFRALLVLRKTENFDELRPIFRKGLEERDEPIALVCIEALTEKTKVDDLEALRLAFNFSENKVKLAAIAVLGASKLPEAMDVLSLWAMDDSVEVRRKALEGIGAIPAGPEWKDKKKKYLTDFRDVPNQDPAVKTLADELLKALG